MLSRCISLARQNPLRKWRFACIITDRHGSIISQSFNSMTKSHPMQYKYACTHGNREQIFLHAEVAALVRCRKVPYALYVARIDACNRPAMARPCEICMEAIKKAHVRYIYFTCNQSESMILYIDKEYQYVAR
jgi:tRNA(Arg) A34 adenosine deaminase TadA